MKPERANGDQAAVPSEAAGPASEHGVEPSGEGLGWDPYQVWLTRVLLPRLQAESRRAERPAEPPERKSRTEPGGPSSARSARRIFVTTGG